MPVPVEQIAFLGVAEDFVRLGSFLELGGRIRVATVAVGMEFKCKCPERFANLLRTGAAGDAQNFVIVPLGAHAVPQERFQKRVYV